MQTARRRPLALVLMLSLAFSFVSAYAIAGENKVITKKEFKTLLKTAKGPAEHRRIAEYYRHEAARLTASAKEHEELAEVYAKNPPFPAMAMEEKRGTSFAQSAPHCKRWAELDAEQAKKANALAAMHENMANAQQK